MNITARIYTVCEKEPKNIEATSETLAYKSDHVYSYEEMSFTRQQIIELYADIFERYDFDKREPTLSQTEQVAELRTPAD